jgi:hypothetical protein
LKQEQPGETGTLIWMGTLKNTTRSHMETWSEMMYLQSVLMHNDPESFYEYS